MSRDGDPAPARLNAGYRLKELVNGLAVDAYGAVRHEDPIEGYRVMTRTRIEPATAGIQAAAYLRRVAAQLIHEQAMAARAQGATWAEIATALGIEGPDWQDHWPAELAYQHVVWDETLPDVSPSWSRRQGFARWTCSTCGKRITDNGPWNPHPDDMEDGHAEDCADHRAALAAWNAEHGGA